MPNLSFGSKSINFRRTLASSRASGLSVSTAYVCFRL